MSPDAPDARGIDRGLAGGSDSADVLGIAGTFPRPGWVVIDAIRERGFTGEVVCATTPVITIHADRGRIYVAERATDPPLSERLVAAGALTTAALEQGIIRLAGAEHLGRLFDRAPQVDRDSVLAANDLINDLCLGWLAAQRVHGAEVTPYRHHPAGVHRWDPVPDDAAPVASVELPAPAAPAYAPPPPAAPAPAMQAPVTTLTAMPAPTAAPMAPPAITAMPSPAPLMPSPAPLMPSPAPLMPPPAAPLAGPPSPPLVEPSPARSLVEPPPARSIVEPPPALVELSAPLLRMPLPASWVAATPAVATERSDVGEPSRATSPDQTDATDDVIRWDEPGFLDRPLVGDLGLGLGLIKPLPTPGPRPVDPAHTPLDASDEPLFARFDRFDRTAPAAPAAHGGDPLSRPTKQPPMPAEPADRFEVIWPSGEVDEQFGGQIIDAVPHPDIDRAGPTARMVRDGGFGTSRAATALQSDPVDDAVADALGAGADDIEVWLASESERDAHDEDVVLAVRRAVASIETGALGNRERRTGPRGMSLSTLDLQLDTGLVPPGRVAVRGETTGEIPLTVTGRMSRPNPSAGSVFDEVPPTAPAPSSTTDAEIVDDEPVERVSALRRLIGSLRRR